MTKSLSLVALVGLLAGLGCGASVCERSTSLGTTAKAKATNCPQFASTFGNSGSKVVCEEKLKVCTSAETSKATAFLDCIDKLPNCVVGQEQAFIDASTACVRSTDGISDACRNALGGT